jgi:hypothetical protein
MPRARLVRHVHGVLEEKDGLERLPVSIEVQHESYEMFSVVNTHRRSILPR